MGHRHDRCDLAADFQGRRHGPLVCRRNLRLKYVELHANSAFSFLQGASLPEKLVAACSEFAIPAMALLDCDGVYGAARFHLTAQKAGIKAHIGAEISWRNDSAGFRNSNSETPVLLPLLVSSQAGYQNLCRLITEIKM